MDGMEIQTVEVTPDAKGGVSVDVPEGMAATPAAPAELSFAPGDLQADLARIAEPVKAVEPEQPATAPATPVPAKFKNPDGSVNEAAVAKSTHNAEEALARYAEIERALRQKQNEVAALKNPAAVQAPQAPQVPVNLPLSPLELSMAQDLLNEAAALGFQMPQAQAIAQARVMARGLEAKHAAELNVVQDIRQRMEIQDRRTELEKIAENDPWVLSPEGVETLSKIRESRSHVNASPTPWTAAYREHLADQVMQSRLTGQVPTPTPTAKTAKAPPTPVNAAPRVVVKPAEPDMRGWSSAQINAYVESLPPKEQDAFFTKRGLKFR